MNAAISTADSASKAAWAILGLFIILNLAATRQIMRNRLSERRQKMLQIMFVWLVPGVGAATFYAVLRDPNNKGSGQYRPDNSLGDDSNVGFSNSANDYFKDGHHGS